MNLDQLKQFLISANKAGYASGEEKNWVKESDFSTTINFESDDFKLHDNFFGGEPYGGRLVVFYKNKPVWMMVYYGLVMEEVTADSIYKVLRNALKNMPEEAPFRGPKEYKEGEFTYINSWDGNVEQFSGKEQIFQGEKLAYKANYIGGLVDQRQGV